MRPVFLLALASLALGSPIESEPQTSVQKRAWSDDVSIHSLENEFKGILWDKAGTTCTEKQMEILVRTLREADKIMNSAITRGAHGGSAAWNRYFVNEDSKLKDTWSKNSNLWNSVTKNMINVAAFPRKGKKNPFPRHNRVSFQCPEKTGTGRCEQKGIDRAAFTQPEGGHDNHEWTTYFCDFFFDKIGPMQAQTDKETLEPSSLSTFKVQEQVMIHELMHSNIVGIRPMTKTEQDEKDLPSNIVDVKAAAPPFDDDEKRPIYGDPRCHGLAWKHMYEDKKSINTKVSINADNYSWFFTYDWLQQEFGWQDDGSEVYTSKRAPSDDVEMYGDELLVDEDDITIDASDPGNCHKGSNGTPECTYDDGETSDRTIDSGVKVECNKHKDWKVPSSAFKGSYGSFCDYMPKHFYLRDEEWQVDGNGTEHWNMKDKREILTPRDDDDPEVVVYLRFKASKKIAFKFGHGSNSCTKTCSDAFDELAGATKCGFVGDDTIIPTEGDIDAGCGVYSYHLYKGALMDPGSN